MTMLTNNRNLSLFEVLVIYFYWADMNLENENVVKLSTYYLEEYFIIEFSS